LSHKYIRSSDELTAMRFGARQHALCVGMMTGVSDVWGSCYWLPKAMGRKV
jgi:hypothetical protein